MKLKQSLIANDNCDVSRNLTLRHVRLCVHSIHGMTDKRCDFFLTFIWGYLNVTVESVCDM